MFNAAWDAGISVASENALPCYDREGYRKILENAKLGDNPDGRHFSAFTYLRLTPTLMQAENLMEFEHFVKKMHGKDSPINFFETMFRVLSLLKMFSFDDRSWCVRGSCSGPCWGQDDIKVEKNGQPRYMSGVKE